VVIEAIEEPQGADAAVADFETLKRRARTALGRFVNERTRRRPMIVPVVMEV
jgi:mRNA degradation ribonuclease J1/J2